MALKEEIVIDPIQMQIERKTEELLYLNPEVEETAVISFSSAEGMDVIAFVVPKTPFLTAAELDSFLESKGIPSYLRPKEYRFTYRIPRTLSGKIQRFKLIKEL